MADEFAALIAKLDALGGDVRVQAERKALRAVGDVVKEVMVENAPERAETPSGTALAPGALKADIRARVHVASDENAATDHSRVTIGPGSKTKHVALWVETGHEVVHGGYSREDGDGGRRGPGTATGKTTRPNPFVRNTQDETEAKAIDTYAEVMKQEIAKAME